MILRDLHTASACLQRAYFDADDADLRAAILRAQNEVTKAITAFIKRAHIETKEAS